MIRLPQPTLTQRVVLTMLFAFALIWIVLLSVQYAEVQRLKAHNPALDNFAAELLDELRGVNEPTQAAIVMGATERAVTGARRRAHIPGSLVFQVWDRQQHGLAFSSSAIDGIILQGGAPRQSWQTVRGQTFQIAALESSRWTVRVGQTFPEVAFILRQLVGDLTKYVLIALPFALVPLWLAVARGLRPLRRLSDRIAARDADDLTPIGVSPKYAELKPMVTALDSLLAKLNVAIKRERALVQDAAHELRTPMAVISAHAHALAKAADEAERMEAERGLDAALGRASRLIHQLLALARLDIEHTPQCSEVDLADLLRRDLATLTPAALARTIELSLESPDRLEARIDVPAFQSIVQNLIENAVRYGNPGGRIIVELGRAGHEISLTVADDGSGIPANDRAMVFDRFYRGSGHESTGTGLGLAIVRQAAVRLGGEVRLADGLDARGSGPRDLDSLRPARRAPYDSHSPTFVERMTNRGHTWRWHPWVLRR